MPSYQVMTEVLNSMFNSANIGKRTARNFTPDTDLFELARRSGTFSRGQVEFFGSFPAGLRAALMGVMRENFKRKEPLAIQFIWEPAYDFGLKIYEAPGTAQSPGGISIVIQTRYPLDTHPSSIEPKRRKKKVTPKKASGKKAASKKVPKKRAASKKR